MYYVELLSVDSMFKDVRRPSFHHLSQVDGRAPRSKKSKAKGKATFKVNRGSRKLKAKKALAEGEDSFLSVDSEGRQMYRGLYSLDELPEEALPRGPGGKHSYTLTDISPEPAAKIEVLLRHRAFFVKRNSIAGRGPIGQVSWARYDTVESAWREAVKRAGFMF